MIMDDVQIISPIAGITAAKIRIMLYVMIG